MENGIEIGDVGDLNLIFFSFFLFVYILLQCEWNSVDFRVSEELQKEQWNPPLVTDPFIITFLTAFPLNLLSFWCDRACIDFREAPLRYTTRFMYNRI